MDRLVCTIPEVCDTVGPGANVRNYLEQRDVRRCLEAARKLKPIRPALDIGCGYGRLTMVLMETAGDVVGFEREAAFVEEARRPLPGATFRHVEALSRLPAPSGSWDVAMTFSTCGIRRRAPCSTT